MTIPLHPKLGNIERWVMEWEPYGTAYSDKRDAIQLAGHLRIFKQGTRVVAWGGLYHVEVWEREDYRNQIRESID